ncbi:uncharacterized protein TNCV_4247511 [Trichonephila clavipes]|nr:uncharacterized protein TNCV_4247511 [Trichonephila clavipes]
MLHYQTDVHIFSQCVWDNQESAPAVIENCSPYHNSRSRFSVCRPQAVWLQAFPWLPSNQRKLWHQSRTSFHQKPQQNSNLSSNELWVDTTSVANSNGLEVKYTLQSAWLGAVLEVTDL